MGRRGRSSARARDACRTSTVSDCPDHEDDRVLECALAAGAVLVVTDDSDLLELSPWQGIPMITSVGFVARVDAVRRARRRKRR